MKYERSLDISGIPEMTELIHDGGKKTHRRHANHTTLADTVYTRTFNKAVS